MVKRVTKLKKENMAILTLEDLDGSLEVLVFPEAYQRYGSVIQQDGAIMVCGEVSRRDEEAKLVAQEIYPLAEAPRHFTQRVSLHVPVATLNDEKLGKVKDILRMHPGVVPVVICMQFPSGEKVFVRTDKSFRVFPNQDLVQELEQELGERGLYVAVTPEACLKPKPKRRQWNGG
jgi:DNA polymerase-3 subunit alpha